MLLFFFFFYFVCIQRVRTDRFVNDFAFASHTKQCLFFSESYVTFCITFFERERIENANRPIPGRTNCAPQFKLNFSVDFFPVFWFLFIALSYFWTKNKIETHEKGFILLRFEWLELLHYTDTHARDTRYGCIHGCGAELLRDGQSDTIQRAWCVAGAFNGAVAWHELNWIRRTLDLGKWKIDKGMIFDC